MKKNLILSAILVVATIGCGSAVPRTTVLEAKETTQPLPLSACGLQVTIPAGWAVEKDLISINDLYVTKDKIDIHIDYMPTESDSTKIGPALVTKIEKEQKTTMKINTTKPNNIGGMKGASILGQAPGNVSIDIYAFNCPLIGSTAFYVVSPIATWKRDNAVVQEMIKTVKTVVIEGAKPKK